ncbi:MAG: UbiD family decarboxylase [Burkholderiaceae bacterium]
MEFRKFLEQLDDAGELLRVDTPMSLDYEVGALCRKLSDAGGPAALLSRVDGHSVALATNLYGTRRRIALGLGLDESSMVAELAQRLKRRVPVQRFTGNAPRCQQRSCIGDSIDVRTLPVPLWNIGDGGPYLTASLVIARHPEFGWNIAHHRCQVYGACELGVAMAPEHQLRLVTDIGRSDGGRVEAAIVLGTRPSISIAASSDFPMGDYELEIAGALENRPIDVVRCLTVDIDVPEDAEIVIEGYFDGEVRSEGPFVEYTGYQSPVIQSPVFRITAITHREAPIMHGIFAGKPPCETDVLWRELEEVEVLQTLRRRFPMLTGVHRPPQIGRDLLVVLQVDVARAPPGMIKTLMLATNAVMTRLKIVIAVDKSVDLYDLTDVMWAVAMHCDIKEDVDVIKGTFTSWIDPASRGLSGKLLLDATRKAGFDGQMPSFPPEALDKAQRLLEQHGLLSSRTPLRSGRTTKEHR